MLSITSKLCLNTSLWASFFAALATAAPSSNTMTKRDFQPGNCGLHLTQFQKAIPGIDPYRVLVSLKDAIGDHIGNTGIVASDQGVDMDSELPFVLVIHTAAVDSDPVGFLYAGQAWTSADKQCKVGKYDHGSRQMDCGFSC